MAVCWRGRRKGAFLCSDCWIESAGFIRLFIDLSIKKRKKEKGFWFFDIPDGERDSCQLVLYV